MKKGIQEEFQDWKNEYGYLEIIHKTSKKNKTRERKKRDKIIEETYLIKDHTGELIISGGGKVLLFMVLIESKNWAKHEKMLLKAKRYTQHLEVKKFRYRQKMYNIDLLDKLKHLTTNEVSHILFDE